METADTGDILLFRTKNFNGKLTRTLTHSYFDHVAMVLRFDTDPTEIFLLESTSTTGVSISKWSQLRRMIGSYYEQVVVRHLEIARDYFFIELLKDFLTQVIGLKYGMSTQKLLFNRVSLNPFG